MLRDVPAAKELFARAGYAEGGVFYAFDGFKGIGERLNFRAGTLHGHYLQATVVVQAHALGRDDEGGVAVLDSQQPVHDLAPVVVVDDGNGAGHGAAFSEGVGHEFFAYQVGDGFGAVGIALRSYEGVELPEELPLKRDAEA